MHGFASLSPPSGLRGGDFQSRGVAVGQGSRSGSACGDGDAHCDCPGLCGKAEQELSGGDGVTSRLRQHVDVG